MKKNCETLPCFLFWRAMLLIGATRYYCLRKGKGVKPSSVLAKRTEKDILESCPVKIRFGRPDFVQLLNQNIDKFGKK